MKLRPAVATALSISVVSLCVIGLVGCTNSSDSGGGAPGSGGPGGMGAAVTPSVEVIQARYGALPLEERMTGIVRASNQVVIYPEITAPVERVVAQNGDYVRQGAALVYLRDKQFTDQLRQVEAALQISKADAGRTEATLNEVRTRLQRAQQLAEKQYQSAQELEALEAELASAEASHQQALARITQAEANVEEQNELVRRTIIRAPVSGYVGLKNVEVGMRVDPSTALYTIGNFSNLRVEVSIPDRMVNRIKVGDPAILRAEDELNVTVEAAVSRISPFLEAGSYSARAEIDVDNRDGVLRPGMFVAVDVLYGESSQATLIPETALYEHPATGVLGVYVAPSLRSETPIEEPETFDEADPPPLTGPTPVEFRSIEVLARGHGVAGVSGLQLGDWVVVVGQNLIRSVDGRAEARARPVTWERIASLQELQDQDLLRQFMEKQQRMAREEFSSPSSSVVVQPDSESAASVLPGATGATPTE